MNKAKQIEITEKAIRSSKDNSGALADLLNQEIKELQRVKEKQIEEMAKDYYGYSIDLEEDCKFVAEEMYDKGHRKINENEVVISKEEYEHINSCYNVTRKEIVEKILKPLYDTCKDLCNTFNDKTDEYKSGVKVCCTIIQMCLNNFAKEFDIDLGE